MQFLEDLVPDVETAAAVKEFFTDRLKLLYHEAGSAMDEWNDAIDSAVRMVVRS